MQMKCHALLFLCAAALYAQETSQNFPQEPESTSADSSMDSAKSLESTADSSAPQNLDSHNPASEISARSISARVDSVLDERKPNEDRVEIIDYKRGKILGYMVLRNGNIIRRVMFKEPKDLHPKDAHTPESPPHSPAQKSPESTPDSLKLDSSTRESSAPASAPKPNAKQPAKHSGDRSTSAGDDEYSRAQSEQESYLSSTPSDKDKSQDKHQEHKSRKHTEADSSTSSSRSQKIEQEIGAEKSRINKTYKNREWDKKKIPHDVQTRVIDIGQ